VPSVILRAFYGFDLVHDAHDHALDLASANAQAEIGPHDIARLDLRVVAEHLDLPAVRLPHDLGESESSDPPRSIVALEIVANDR